MASNDANSDRGSNLIINKAEIQRSAEANYYGGAKSSHASKPAKTSVFIA